MKARDLYKCKIYLFNDLNVGLLASGVLPML